MVPLVAANASSEPGARGDLELEPIAEQEIEAPDDAGTQRNELVNGVMWPNEAAAVIHAGQAQRVPASSEAAEEAGDEAAHARSQAKGADSATERRAGAMPATPRGVRGRRPSGLFLAPGTDRLIRAPAALPNRRATLLVAA
jgi:hypothetical protein